MTSLQNLLITEAKVVMMKCLYVQEEASDLTDNLDNVTISVLMTQDLTGSDLSMVSLLSWWWSVQRSLCCQGSRAWSGAAQTVSW